jgi:hypothetical protein
MTRLPQKYRKNFENLAKLMGIPIQFGMVSSIAAKLNVSRDNISNWMTRGVPHERIDLFKSAGYPLEDWWEDTDEVPTQAAEDEGRSRNTIFHTSKMGQLDEEIDPLLAAIANLKAVFDSGNPVLISAIQANLATFWKAANDKEIRQELKQLRKAYTELLKAHAELSKEHAELSKEHAELSNEVRALKQRGDAGSGDLDDTGTDPTK